MTKDTASVPSFDIGDFEAAETGKMQILDVQGKPTGWWWEFAGPGHPKTEALSSRRARERLLKAAQVEQSQVNGRKWKAEAGTPDEVRAENIADIVERLIGWSEVMIGGEVFDFSPSRAQEFLANPKRIGVLVQAMEFLADEKSFTPRSE